MTEDQSPFKPSRTQLIFKNAANVSLRGSTFDATHMDKFLQSGFGETSMMMQTQESPKYGGAFSRSSIGPGGGGGSNLMSYMAS